MERYNRFSKKEILVIFDYMDRNRDIGPTTKSYYQKFVAATRCRHPWIMVYHKVQSMRNYYDKVKSWLLTEEAKNLTAAKGVKFVKKEVCQMCPHFERLDRIFGDPVKDELLDAEDTSSSTNSQPAKSDAQDVDEEEIADLTPDNEEDAEFLMETTPNEINSIIVQEPAPPTVPDLSTLDSNDVPQPNAADFTVEHAKGSVEEAVHEKTFQPEVNDTLENLPAMKMHKERMQLERKKLRAHRSIEKRKLALDELSLEMSIDWQNKWLDLKKAQQESKERLVKFALELKQRRSKKKDGTEQT